MKKVIAVVVMAALLSGCGSSSPSAKDASVPEVASVSKAPATAAASKASAQGPRARLDTTRAEKEAWARAYWQCMKDNGARVDDSEKAKVTGFVDPSQASPAAFSACASKKPNFVPEEMDESLNPNYKQQWHEHVACLKKKGMPVVETNDGWTWESSNVVIPSDAKVEQIEQQCQMEVFARN